MKILRALAVCLVFSIFLTQTAYAQSVTYEGASKSFVFTPGSSDSPSDLFGDFKQILPGDTLVDEVEIRANPRKNHRVCLYLRADGVESETVSGFLAQLRLRLTRSSGEVIFDGSLDKATGAIYLGSFTQGDVETLSMTLYAPLELPNLYQDAISVLGWTFLAEELPLPTQPGKGDGPKTGDSSFLPASLFFFSSGCLLALSAWALYQKSREKVGFSKNALRF